MTARQLEIRVNGVLAAFQREPGCACPRCRDDDPTQRNNSSVSLLVWEGDKVLEHHLVDAGLGVVQELVNRGGPWPVDSVLLTHGHFDHFAELDWLATGQRRSGLRGAWPDRLLPVWCPDRTWSFAVAQQFPKLAAEGDAAKAVHRSVRPGQRFTPGQCGALAVTPIPVKHHLDSVIYVVEFWTDASPLSLAGPAPFKAVLAWDLERFLAPGDEPNTAGHDHHPLLTAQAPILSGPDLLLVEMNTWNTHPAIPHQGLAGVLEQWRAWRPAVTRVIHYSGHEDGPPDASNCVPTNGPVNAAALERALVNACDSTVGVARVGDRFFFPPKAAHSHSGPLG